VRKIRDVIRLNRVLIHGIARPSADAQILRGLEERGSDWEPVELGPQAIDNLRRSNLALIERFERNID
jgi:hypothetical protein